MKKLNLLILTMILSVLGFAGNAQIVTTSPSPLQENSKDVEIYFHADMGNKGLINLSPSDKVYAHTGVEVETPTGKTNWKYAPTWGNNDAKYQLSYVSSNLWKLSIGDMRTYYGVAANETITRLCFVFRNANCSKEGKGDGNSDIFVDVLSTGLQIALSNSAGTNIVDGNTGAVTFTVGTTQAADITLTLDGTIIGSVKNATTLSATHTFTSPGDYVVKATATDGTTTVEDSQTITYLRESPKASDTSLPAQGCTLNSDGSYTFCLIAPNKKGSVLVGSWNDYAVSNDFLMEYVDHTMSEELAEGGETVMESGTFRYFKITVPAGKITAPFSYYYLVDGKAVGDAYARLILDPKNDKYISSNVYPNLPQYPDKLNNVAVSLAYWADDLLDYKWENTNFDAPAKDNLIIYELLLRDFTGTEGKADGNGSLRAAIEKLPYLRNLGVNAIELLPINEFNGNNSWGYNPNFYFAPDKAYGTPQDYKEFIDICHGMGMAVILDMVFNQTDWQHPWYQMYDGVMNNPFYNASAPHAYSVLNDYNQGYPPVLQQERDCVKFWMQEYKVDGFRFDLVKGLGLNNSYSSDSGSATDAYNRSRVVRMKAIHDAVREVNPNGYFINENLAGSKEENEMAQDGELNWANFNNAGCQYAMGYKSDSGLLGMWAQKNSRINGSTVSYLESHDEERLAYKQDQFGETGVKGNHAVSMQRLGSTAAQMILTPGSHMIWMFSEMGNAQTTKGSSGNNTSPKIVNWNLLNNPDNAGLMQSYKELIRLRLTYPQLFSNEAGMLQTDNPFFNNSTSLWERGRYIYAINGDEELYCLINPNVDGVITMNVPFKKSSQDAYQIASKSYNSEPVFNVSGGTVDIPANCYVVIASKGISGVEQIGADSSDMLRIVRTANGICVENAEGTVEVFTLSGMCVGKAPAAAADFTLTSGIYLVRNGEKVIKVAL